MQQQSDAIIVLMRLGTVETHAQNLPSAVSFLEQSLVACKKFPAEFPTSGQAPQMEGGTLGSLGSLHIQMGEFEQGRSTTVRMFRCGRIVLQQTAKAYPA